MSLQPIDCTNDVLKAKLTDAVVFRRNLTSSDDLDEIKQPGTYLCDNSGPANAPADSPRFILTVARAHASSPNYVTQEVTTNSGVIYRRMWWYSAWTAWKKVVVEVLS